MDLALDLNHILANLSNFQLANPVRFRLQSNRSLLDEGRDAVVLRLVQQLLHVHAGDDEGARPQVVEYHFEQLGIPEIMTVGEDMRRLLSCYLSK